MELDKKFCWKNWKYLRFYDDVKSFKKNDLELVCISNSTTNNELSSEMTSINNSECIDNIFDYFESPSIARLISANDKIFLFKLQIQEAITSTELNKLAKKFEISSVVILLSTEKGKRFFLYWKSQKIQHFLIFKIYNRADFMHDLRLFEFIANFLANSLKCGHLGLHSQLEIKPDSNSYELHLLADHRNYNLLLVAAEMGDIFVVNFMIDGGFSTEARDTNAQTLAWNGRHFDILYELLKSNHTFPDSINIEECPDSIKLFYQVSQDLNKAMILRDIATIQQILSENPKLIHFYNLENESILKFALRNKLFDIYRLLISNNNLRFGPHEKFSEIKESLRQNDKEELREIHYKESKSLPDNHMHVLLSNSRLGHGTKDTEKKFAIIQKAFEILNENPFIQVILMVVAASRNFRIIFDFNFDSVEVLDPTANETSRGSFYLTGRIYIGAKKLLDECGKFEALGTLAHELCHYAVNVVYKNVAKPYVFGDDDAKQDFEKILESCKENCGKEEIIDLVHQIYPHHMQHAELIVRVPHLIMQYWNDEQKFMQVKKKFNNLFNIFEKKIIPEMKEMLPNIETKADCEVQTKNKKIRKLKLISMIGGLLSIIIIICGFFITRSVFYKPTYKFSSLSNSDQMKIATAPIDYKGIRLELNHLLPNSSKIYEKLSSDHISIILHENKPLNLSDNSTFYLEGFISHNWRNLSEKLKQQILISNFTFQNQNITFGKLNQHVLESLTSQQIIDILENKTLIVHEMIKNKEQLYIERKFFDIEQFSKLMFCKNESMKTCEYNGFYGDFKQDLQLADLNNINAYRNKNILQSFSNSIGTLNVFNSYQVENLFTHKSFQLSFDDVWKKVSHSKIFLLSSEKRSGKTTTFKEFALRIKKIFPDWWVSYIDRNILQNFCEYKRSQANYRTKIEKFINLSSSNNFERTIFNECFKSGKLIIFWDVSDEIGEVKDAYLLDIITNLEELTKNIQFISSRPFSYVSTELSRIKVKTYTFLPVENFMSKSNRQFSSLVNIHQLVKTISSVDYNIPSLILTISDLSKYGKEFFGTENVFEIFEKFLKIKIDILIESKIDKNLTIATENLKKFFQKHAFKVASKSFSFIMNSQKLKIMNSEDPKEFTKDEILSMNIVNSKIPESYEFPQELYIDFFIAQYLIDNICNMNDLDNSSTDELDLRLRVLFDCFEDKKCSIFIDSYLELNATNFDDYKFNSKIANHLKTKFRIIFLNLLNNNNLEPLLMMIKFFSIDYELLTDILQVNQNKTLFTEVFGQVKFGFEKKIDFFYYNLELMQQIGELFLNDLEKQKFLHGKNQKGIVLFVLHCNYMKEKTDLYDQYSLKITHFRGKKPNAIFDSISKNLTLDEYKELLKSKVLMRSLIEIGKKSMSIFIQKILKEIEEKFTIEEQKQWLDEIIQTISFSADKTLFKFFKNKLEKTFTNSELLKLFLDNQILQIAGTYIHLDGFYFDTLWKFYVNHSTEEDQKSILKHTAEIKCTDDFILNCLASKYTNFNPKDVCNLHPKLNLFHISKLNSLRLLVDYSDIYKTFFNSTEIQDIILGSDIFLPLFINFQTNDDFQSLIFDLKLYFKGNENKLKNFLMKAKKSMKNLDYSQSNYKLLSKTIDNLSIS